MKITAKPILIGSFILVTLFCLFFVFRNTDPSDTTILLHDDQIEVQKLTNAIAGLIIEYGYGYKVKLVESTIKEVHERIIRGDIDITLEMWKENNLLWYEEALKQGQIIDLGMLYDSGRQYWIVSRWYAEEKGIRTVLDMRDHWQDFADPDEPSKGIFFNCIYGWTCRDINRVKLSAYGLDRFYNTISPLSPESLKSIYEKSHQKRIPVFGYYWEPNSLMFNNDWHILEEPPYDRKLWTNIVTASSSLDDDLQQACEYPQSGVHKIANSRLGDKAPDVVAMLIAMRVDIHIFNEILFKVNNRDGTGYIELAKFYLHQYPQEWASWVTGEAKDKILKAMASDLALN